MGPPRKTKREASSGNSAQVGSPPPKKRRQNLEGDDWNQNFFELMLYRAKTGHINVKCSDDENVILHQWILSQRKAYKQQRLKGSEGSVLTADRIKVLESVKFNFGTRGDENWINHYNQLKEFKEKHGHVLVPRDSEKQGLGDWVVTQRMLYNKTLEGKSVSQLTPLRKDMLDEIGFVWKIRVRPAWQSRFEELVEFKSKIGHTVSFSGCHGRASSINSTKEYYPCSVAESPTKLQVE